MTYQNHEIGSSSTFTYRDIRVTLDDNKLSLENSKIARVLDLKLSIPCTVSFKDKRVGMELAAECADMDFSFVGMNMPCHVGPPNKRTEYSLGKITATAIEGSIFDSEHVCVKLMIHENIQQLLFTRKYFIYPDLPFMSSQTGIISKVMPLMYWTRRGEMYKRDLYGQDDPEILES